MDKSSVLETLCEFRHRLEDEGIGDIRMILFGSYAHGTAHEYSDIDVIVISEDFKDKSYWDRIQVLSDAIFSVFKPIEAVAFTPDEWEQGDSVFVEFAKGGEVVLG